MLLLTFKVLRGQAPLYLEKLIAPDHPNRPLSSESAGLLELLRIFQSRMGVWAFCTQAPLMWDLLPVKVAKVFLLLWSGWKPSSLRGRLIVRNFIYTVIILTQLMFIVGASHLTFSHHRVMLLQGTETWSTDIFLSLYWFMVACLHFLSPSSLHFVGHCLMSLTPISCVVLCFFSPSLPLHCRYQQDGSTV